ncbi:MAG: hypothetical protein OEM43_02475 [Gammaproteobacteria bacterium]|nr:hypothetical protein [Gammaproteobacteria bacterium]
MVTAGIKADTEQGGTQQLSHGIHNLLTRESPSDDLGRLEVLGLPDWIDVGSADGFEDGG